MYARAKKAGRAEYAGKDRDMQAKAEKQGQKQRAA